MKLSQVPVRIVSTRTNSDGSLRRVHSASFDALAYDKVSERPSTGGLTETLLAERYSTLEGSGPTKPTSGELVRKYYAESFQQTELVRKVDTMYRPSTRLAYLQANSIDNILLPAAADMLCPKCGMTLGCRCHMFDSRGVRILCEGSPA